MYEWLKSTHKELLIVKKENQDSYKRTIDVLSNNLKGLQSAIQTSEESSRFEYLTDLLSDSLLSVSQEITEIQANERFIPQADDSFYVSVLKLFKRFLKPGVANGDAAKKEWKQKIALRDLITDQLMSDLSWAEIWLSESYRDTTEILDLLLEKKTENSDENQAEAEVRSSFKIEVIDEIEQQLEKAIKRIESDEMLSNEKLSESIGILRDQLIEKGERAGTIEGKKCEITHQNFRIYRDKQQQKFNIIEKSWLSYLESQISDLRIQTEIAEYGYQASETQKGILDEMHVYFRDFGYVPMEKGVSAAKEIVTTLNNGNRDNLSKKNVDQIREKLDLEIKDAILVPMQKKELQQKILDRVRDKISELKFLLNKFSETVELAEKREIQFPKPVVDLDQLKWQSLASRFLQEKALREMQPEKLQLVQFISQKAVDVEETLQIVDVNLMAALESELDDEEEESPLEIAVSGLERAVNLFEQSIKSVREKQNQYEDLVLVKLSSALFDLANIMHSRSYDTFELRDKALQVKERATDWKLKLQLFSDKWIEKTEILWRFLNQKFKKGKNFTLRTLGFQGEEAVSTTERRNLTEYLVRINKDQQLPFIYKRLFDYEFEIDERFYTAPDRVHESIENAFTGWKNGLDNNVLIMGEKGSGKSATVRFLSNNLFEEDEPIIIRFDTTFYKEEELLTGLCKGLNYNKVESRDELIEKIGNRRKKSVIVIENLHNAYIRNIHGFEAIQAFWEIMSATKDKFFWVVTSSRYASSFFEKMSGSDQLFSHITAVDNLDKDKLQKAILTRHKSTGYNLIFEPSPTLKNSRAYRKLIGDEEQEQKYLSEYYFSKLANVAEGNLSIAIIFWMQSIREYDDVAFRIAPLEVADVDKIEAPARNVLFTLAAFALHGQLTVEQMAIALHQDITQSRLMLERLKSKGIIFRTAENEYDLNQLVYRQVIRLLKRRNIIH